ncbi:GIY-YIG nuclease family protein [Vagococcus lutrae]|nr:GIY-YIG nuclease family protein [Vagococcus lutrae]MDT2818120.1 GIY-YIG nuclease family protein [Vagococcus lutrae]
MYLDLKLSELYLAYEYERKKQDEKEALREQREREREEKALQKEIQSKKKIIDKDIKHYQNLINELKKKMNELTSEEERDSIEQQIIDLNVKVNEREEEKKELDYRTAHASAGYVYIISNIGAFGDDVVKIGVTRRIDPLERINELSSASVPFKFDVHALIFSYDAYKLETELHQYFDSYRINKVNNRKEFFKVPISKIEEKLSEYGELTIDFKANVDAEEYRESLLLK